MRTSMSELLPQHRLALNYYLQGLTKKAAVQKAGFSPLSASDVFERQDVRDEIERRLSIQEKKTDMDREWLLGKLRTIIDAEPGEMIEVDLKGRPSVNFERLTPALRKAISKVTVETSRDGGKYKRTKTHVQIQTPDKINAIKEAATLLGLREEKHKIDMEEGLINILSQRRRDLAGNKEEDNGE